MPQNLRVFGQVTYELDHESDQLIALVLVNWVCKTVFNRGNFRLMDEMPVKLGLTRHVTESNTS